MDFEKSVFINCPFDEKYINDIMKPMLYMIVRNGLSPRLSLEASDSGKGRLEKITELIKGCKYSIHDLSIVKSTVAEEFARMNMPFELGIDFGLRHSGVSPLNSKQFLILGATNYDYMKAVSDLNAFDIKVHGNEMVKIFECMYSWCSETLNIRNQPPPSKLQSDFEDFIAKLFVEKAEEYGSDRHAKNYIDSVTIPDYIEEIRKHTATLL